MLSQTQQDTVVVLLTAVSTSSSNAPVRVSPRTQYPTNERTAVTKGMKSCCGASNIAEAELLKYDAVLLEILGLNGRLNGSKSIDTDEPTSRKLVFQKNMSDIYTL